MGIDAWKYSPFSEIKLPALSSRGIFVGENKFTFLLHEGEDEAGENIPFCAPVE